MSLVPGANVEKNKNQFMYLVQNMAYSSTVKRNLTVLYLKLWAVIVQWELNWFKFEDFMLSRLDAQVTIRYLVLFKLISTTDSSDAYILS